MEDTPLSEVEDQEPMSLYDKIALTGMILVLGLGGLGSVMTVFDLIKAHTQSP